MLNMTNCMRAHSIRYPVVVTSAVCFFLSNNQALCSTVQRSVKSVPRSSSSRGRPALAELSCHDWLGIPDRTSNGRVNYLSSLHAAMSKTQTAEEAVELNPDFSFDLSGDPYNDFLDDHLDVQDLVKKGSKPVR